MTAVDIDALFVINQDTDLDALAEICNRQRPASILVLSTHHLFENERQAVSGLPGVGRVEFREFGDLLTDAQMEGCDDEATRLLAGAGGERPAPYAVLHMAKSGYLKNSLIHRELSATCRAGRVFYTPGIGVSEQAWREVEGSAPLPRIARTAAKPAPGACRSAEVLVVDSARKRLFMVAGVGRLHPVDPGEVRRIRLGAASRWLGRLRPLEPYRRLIRAHSLPGVQSVVGTTIHQYDARLAGLGYPVEIFVDGYQPSNYPRTYLDGFGEGAFVVRDMFDAAWFGKHGRQVLKPYAFLRPIAMEAPRELPRGVGKIYLMLNHAGDWSALINRSDTDILVERFVESARRHPEVRMVVRCHPTMAIEQHEGVGSIERIRRHVDGAGLSNLAVSEAGLAEDMDDADVIVSEYSNVILDGFRRGTLGLIANCTRRRNFMQDYTDLGFATASTATELGPSIDAVVTDSRTYLRRQAQAAARYNELLDEFVRNEAGEAVGTPSSSS